MSKSLRNKRRYTRLSGGSTTQHRRRNNKKKDKSKGFRSEGCSPYSLKRKVVKGSCYTKGVLIDMKTRYNRMNVKSPSQKILSNDPVQIYNELREKMPYCKKESCWVQKIADPAMKTKMMSLLFAPPQPSEWKQNPSQWLSNFDILHVLEQYEKTFPHFIFLGPSPIDYNFRKKEDNMKCVTEELCKFSLQEQFDNGKKKIGVIFNLDKHNQGGSHWVSLFIDIEDKFIFYFDSTSDPAPKEVKEFMKTVQQQGKQMKPLIKFPKPIVNNKFEHQLQNNECGMYSLFFIITMLIREKDSKKLTTDETIELFLGKTGRISDRKMNELRDDYFLEEQE